MLSFVLRLFQPKVLPAFVHQTIELEDYTVDELGKLPKDHLQFIYDSNTAWDAEPPCMFESYKLNIIEQLIK